MPLYLGHKNAKGLAVSPALQSLKIDLLRAAPSAVNVIARPLVTQPGYASYINHLPAFIKATNENTVIPLVKQGYPTAYSIDKVIPVAHPSVVFDYNGPIPSKHVEALTPMGFERIKIQRNDHVIRVSTSKLDNIRVIKTTSPSMKTHAPAGTVNLEAFDNWILVLRIVSALLRTHVYPAFRDGDHEMDEVEDLVEEIMISKRKLAEGSEESDPKRARTEVDDQANPTEATDVQMPDIIETPLAPSTIELRKAKPVSSNELPWGTVSEIPNTSGVFFPFIPELASYDNDTVPDLIETYLLQSLGTSPEAQVERLARIKSAWGIISKTDSGNVMAHLCRIIHLSITSQGRCFPIIQDGIYQGSVLLGGRLFIGLNGSVFRPLSYDKLQEETGNYHLHSRVLAQIAELAIGTEFEGADASDLRRLRTVTSVTSNRALRAVLMQENLSESDRDEIRKLAVNLRFKGDNHLPVNPQTLNKVLLSMSATDEQEDMTLPMHHSALFSRDKVFVSLSAFGYQAPSFNIDNCPKISLKDAKPPNTLVIRQKPLEVATLDWKGMIDSGEIKNNPRNLSRANRDRTITGNDKTIIWKSLKDMCGANEDRESGGAKITSEFVVDDGANLDEW